MKSNDLKTFVRFGILKPVLQKGYGKDSFHSPPAKYGFYAFSLPLQEFYLIGSLYKTQPQLFPKDYGGSFHASKLQSIRKSFKKSKGEVWSHLGNYMKNSNVIARHNSWVKSDLHSWRKAIKKAITNYLGEYPTNTVAMTHFSKDYFEVFFEKI